MARSLKKFQILSKNVYERIELLNFNISADLAESHNSKIKKRFENRRFFILSTKSITITREMVGFLFLLYNGLKFHSIFIKDFMVGCKLGEFFVTKDLGMKIHLEKKKKKKSIK